MLFFIQASSANAFDLIGGLVSAGADAVGNVGKLVYHNLTDDTPQQAAVKQRKVEDDAIAAFRKAQIAIEVKPGLTPLQREHAQIALNSQYKVVMGYLADQAERENAQREAYSQALSGAGILNTLGQSAAKGVSVAVSSDNPLNMSDKELIARGRSMSQAAQPSINAVALQTNAVQSGS